MYGCCENKILFCFALQDKHLSVALHFNLKFLLSLSGSSKTLLAREECVFCRKQKTQKGSGYEKLVVCTTEASATCLLEFRDNVDDFYASVQLACLDTPTVIAKEFKYHRTYYQSLRKQKDNHNKEKDPKDASQEIRERCFKELIEYVQEQIIEKGFLLDFRHFQIDMPNIRKKKA